MEGKLESIVIAIIAGIPTYYITQRLPPIQTSSEVLQYVNHPFVQFVALLIIFWYLLTHAISWARRRIRDDGTYTLIGRMGPPREIRHKRQVGTAEMFGVNWEWEYGSQYITDDEFALADGPFCPECGSKMMDDEMKRRIRSNKPMWVCSACPFSIARPSRHLYREKKAVENYVESQIRGPDRFGNSNNSP